MSLLLCRRVTLWLFTSVVPNCSMSTARARRSRYSTRRCESVTGVDIAFRSNNLPPLPSPVGVVGGRRLQRLKAASSLSGAMKRFAFCFPPWLRLATVALERQSELCNMLPYMNTCSCVLHARETVFCRVAGVQGFGLFFVGVFLQHVSSACSKGEKVSACPSYFDRLRCMICCYLCKE